MWYYKEVKCNIRSSSNGDFFCELDFDNFPLALAAVIEAEEVMNFL